MFDAQAIIAEATAETPKVETAAPEQELQATSKEAQAESQNESTETSESPKEAEDISKKADSELTPEQLAKREENRQSHLNRKIAKQRLRNENAELKAKLAELQPKQPTQQKDSGVPKLENYESLDEWVLATAEHLNNAKSNTQKEAESTANIDSQKQVRIREIVQQEELFIKSVPEYAALVKENAEFLNEMPEAIKDAFFEIRNAPLALYALMKDGILEDLEDLSPMQIAMEIGKAEERGKSYLSPVKKATNASAPIESLKGTGRATKDLDSMSVEELMKKFNR